jgi:hypothetical protein
MRTKERQQYAGILHLVKRQGLEQAVVQLETGHHFLVENGFLVAELER